MRPSYCTWVPIVWVLSMSCAHAAGQVKAVWRHTTPMVVDPCCTEDVVLEVGIEGSPSGVRLSLASSDAEIPLVDDGSGVDKMAGDGTYSASVEVADALYDFTQDDVNRNFVGYLRLYNGPTIAVQYNLFFDILTKDIPEVDIRQVSDAIQYTPHLVNIVSPDFFEDLLISSVLQQFYAQFSDDYDFVNVIYERAHFANRYHFVIRNDIQGIGPAIFDNTATHGSKGRLLGCTVFPMPGLFDGASPDYQHELGHQWIAYLPGPPLNLANPHWPLSDLASGIMGWAQERGGQGLQFNYDLVPQGDDYLLVADRDPKVFKDLDLYLMGLIGPDQVGEHFVFSDQTMSPGSTMLHGPVTTVTIDEIIARVGPRVPDHTVSPKTFTVATLIISKEGLVSEETMRLYDCFSARAMGEQDVPYSAGFAKGQAKPFHLSTGGLARLDARIQVVEGPCIIPDDVRFGMKDLQVLANNWLSSCGSSGWCEDTDYNHSGTVNLYDFACLAGHWGVENLCGYSHQASYDGDCGQRPPGTICAKFSDGYRWLLSEGPVAWDKDVDCQGRPVEIMRSGSADYYHVLGTDLVRIVKEEEG